jgi:Glyoxalase superfamily protein/Clp amino terminal domain, pathogenicity island component
LRPSGYGERIAALKTLCPNERVSNASPGTSCFVQAKDEDMRDFRDAKVMGHILRAALAAKGLKITISQSLELIAEIFGVTDWNTLAAAIPRNAITPDKNASALPLPTAEKAPDLGPALFAHELELTLHRALACANQRDHEHGTLEHLLLALIDDPDASAVMKACNLDLAALKRNLASHVDNELGELVNHDGDDATPTSALQRVIQRAVTHVESSGGGEVTGADVLVGLFVERESHAAYFLQEQDMTRYDAINYISHGIVKGIVKGSGTRKRGVEQGVVRHRSSDGRTKPVVVEKVKWQRPPRDGKTARDAK